MLSTVPSPVRGVLVRFRDALAARFGARLLDVRLFGSWARGEAHKESDVDVFVLLDRVEPAWRDEIFDLAGRLWSESGLFLSVVVYDRARFERFRRQERPLVMDVEREGIRP